MIVDYLQLMTSGTTVENRVQEVSQISRSLKVLARDLEVPIIALSQLSRAVEQRHDKRPILSDLRESGCLSGETRVFLPDEGVYRPIRELVGREGFRVLAVDTESWQLEPRSVTRAFATGSKPVLRLTTRLGHTIRATANHKFLAFDGWRRLDDLAPGMRISVPRVLPGPTKRTMSDPELALLGHLIGDGCTLPRHTIQYTSKDADLAETVADLARQVFGADVRPRIRRERSWFQTYLVSTARLTHGVRNPVAALAGRARGVRFALLGEARARARIRAVRRAHRRVPPPSLGHRRMHPSRSGRWLSRRPLRLDERAPDSRCAVALAATWNRLLQARRVDGKQRTAKPPAHRFGQAERRTVPGCRRGGRSTQGCRMLRASGAACEHGREHEPRHDPGGVMARDRRPGYGRGGCHNALAPP